MTPFTCIICCETQTARHLTIDGSDVCHACFRQLFVLAIASESDYPAHWSDKPLKAAPYAHILGQALLQEYNAKTLEYTCPATERIYCQGTVPPHRLEPCGHFVGRWRSSKSHVECERCSSTTCLRCGEILPSEGVGPADGISHKCDVRRVDEFEDLAFRGLKRGKDYQICPNEDCRRKIQLTSGCNFVKCQCRAHWCYICGKIARDGQGHWKSIGGCPRFGQPDNARAIYDDVDFWDDNEDIIDDWIYNDLMDGHPAPFLVFERPRIHDEQQGVALQAMHNMQQQRAQERADANREAARGQLERRHEHMQNPPVAQAHPYAWLRQLRQNNGIGGDGAPVQPRFPHVGNVELPRPPISKAGSQRAAARSPSPAPSREAYAGAPHAERAAGVFSDFLNILRDLAPSVD